MNMVGSHREQRDYSPITPAVDLTPEDALQYHGNDYPFVTAWPESPKEVHAVAMEKAPLAGSCQKSCKQAVSQLGLINVPAFWCHLLLPIQG